MEYVVSSQDPEWGWGEVIAEGVVCDRCHATNLRRVKTIVGTEQIVNTWGHAHGCDNDHISRTIHEDRIRGPHASIQWKGTDVCMDVYCECGAHGHVDADFAYHYHCHACGQLWSVGANVRLHRLTREEADKILADGLCIVGDDELQAEAFE